MPRLSRGDRQRLTLGPAVVEPQRVLIGVQPLLGGRLQQLHLRGGVRGPDVLDLPRPTPIGVHDLHRDRTAGVFASAHTRQRQAKDPELVRDPRGKPLANRNFIAQNIRNGASQVAADSGARCPAHVMCFGKQSDMRGIIAPPQRRTGPCGT